MTFPLRLPIHLGLMLLLVTGFYAPSIGANGQLKLKSGNDTTLSGAQVQGRTVIAEVGGNLTLESRQNTTNAAGQDAGLSFGSSRVGINGANRNQRRRWTDDPTSLIGTESVNVNVKGNTKLVGAVLAQINENGQDGGNLRLNTQTLTYKDLIDSDNTSNWSAGISTGMRWNTPPKQGKAAAKTKQEKSGTKSKKDKDFPNASTTSIQVSLNGYVRGQLTRATLGQGSLSLRERAGVRGDLAGLNRNIDAFQTVTANRNTGGLNVDVTIDHRMLSKEGWKLIGRDFKDTYEHGQDVAGAIGDVITEKNIGIQHLGGRIRRNTIATSIKNVLVRNPNRRIGKTDITYGDVLVGLQSQDALVSQGSIIMLGKVAQEELGLSESQFSEFLFYDARKTTGSSLRDSAIFNVRGATVADPLSSEYGNVYFFYVLIFFQEGQ